METKNGDTPIIDGPNVGVHTKLFWVIHFWGSSIFLGSKRFGVKIKLGVKNLWGTTFVVVVGGVIHFLGSLFFGGKEFGGQRLLGLKKWTVNNSILRSKRSQNLLLSYLSVLYIICKMGCLIRKHNIQENQ